LGVHSQSNFQIKVWQNKVNESHERSANRSVILNYKHDHNDIRCLDQIKSDELIKLYGDSDIGFRLCLTAHLDLPRNDEKDWREFASICKLDHYLPYFSSQHSPTTHLMDLWEAKLLTNCHSDNDDTSIRQRINNGILKQNIIDVLSDMQRDELISIVWNEE